ncbi:hypothetical protein MKQ70_23480 [Chitinophaga sedimenti]|uniref:hypothetical protein n=1 Tax=Chitinophaga sedimenti TaxID=2033606 RepID=UPI0020068231|nr:hypothetical protein [Chitinophaga sedimenti]MCK7557806.1 hypothetical protein [Chitinophaga sedimenti]
MKRLRFILISGTRWEKDGKVNYITNLDAWRMEAMMQDAGTGGDRMPDYNAPRRPPSTVAAATISRSNPKDDSLYTSRTKPGAAFLIIYRYRTQPYNSPPVCQPHCHTLCLSLPLF